MYADDSSEQEECRIAFSCAKSYAQRRGTGKLELTLNCRCVFSCANVTNKNQVTVPMSTCFQCVCHSSDVGSTAVTFISFFRKCTYTRKRYRRWSTLSAAQHRTTLSHGLQPTPLIVTSVKGCCGASPGRVSSALSARSSVTRSARICWTPTACRVSNNKELPSQFVIYYRLKDFWCPADSGNCYCIQKDRYNTLSFSFRVKKNYAKSSPLWIQLKHITSSQTFAITKFQTIKATYLKENSHLNAHLETLWNNFGDVALYLSVLHLSAFISQPWPKWPSLVFKWVAHMHFFLCIQRFFLIILLQAGNCAWTWQVRVSRACNLHTVLSLAN